MNLITLKIGKSLPESGLSQREEGSLVVLTEGPSSKHPDSNNRMEIIDLSRGYNAIMDDAE